MGVCRQCHYSYSDCGLGSDGTDRLVKLVQEAQHRRGFDGRSSLFGAKITGGGSGGSICVMGRNCIRSSEEILQVTVTTQTLIFSWPVIDEINENMASPDSAEVQSCHGIPALHLRRIFTGRRQVRVPPAAAAPR